MEPLNAARDPEPEERDVIRSELRNALNVITGRTQLLQRQVLRADGLLNLERDQLLSGLAATLEDVRRMGLRLEDAIAEQATLSDMPTRSPMAAPDVAVVVWDTPITGSGHALAHEPD